jgi:hypothetical protein
MDVVYIPTLSRIDVLRKNVPQWIEQGLQVRLVIDRIEWSMHTKLKRDEDWGSDVYILPLPLSARGIGYSRNYCVQHAKKTALESIIMSDDECLVHPDSNACMLLEEAEKPGVLGVGATRSIHDMFTDGAVSKNNGVILCPGGWGFQLFSLNIKTALECGNFDPKLHTFGEDAELAREGIVRGIPWRVHCGVKYITSNKRQAPGGISAKHKTAEARLAAEQECQAIIHKRWSDYTSVPGKKSRMSWQKLLDDNIPNWKVASAIHGGDIRSLEILGDGNG